jgi:hypothetical protein
VIQDINDTVLYRNGDIVVPGNDVLTLVDADSDCYTPIPNPLESNLRHHREVENIDSLAQYVLAEFTIRHAIEETEDLTW